MRTPLTRCLPATLALLLACAKAGVQPTPPMDQLHFPAWLATFGEQLLVVNLDQDLAYDGGSLVAFDVDEGSGTFGEILADGSGEPGGAVLPNVPGMIRVPTDDEKAGCAGAFASGFPADFALVGGRTEDVLLVETLEAGKAPACVPVGSGSGCRTALKPFSSTAPYGVGFTCSNGIPRAWVGFEQGKAGVGYVTQLDLRTWPPVRAQVNVGYGTVRSFAYDEARDRLYFTGKEHALSAPIRWIDVGDGCKAFDDDDGVQDQSRGGCHVDAGFDLSRRLRGAEPNDLKLSSREFPCTSGGYSGTCRRAYVSVRLYDADAAAYLGARPAGDIGGLLVVLELPEGGAGRPDPQWVGSADIGIMAGSVLNIPRTGKRDLVVVTAVDDHLVWIWDDELGAMVKVFGRDAWGIPLLGHKPSGLASVALDAATVRVFVSAYKDDWVQAIDIPLDDPASASVALQTGTSAVLKLQGTDQ